MTEQGLGADIIMGGKEGEATLAKQIEEGRKEIAKTIFVLPFTFMQISRLKADLLKGCPTDHCLTQVRISQVSLPNAAQICTTKMSLLKIRSSQISLLEMC